MTDRRAAIDGLRGLMLILMTFTHLPTQFSTPLGQPLGFVSAAEGFVFLSAYLVGLVYTRSAKQRGLREMRAGLADRALKVYGAHVAILLAVLVLVAMPALQSGNREIANWLSFYAQEPERATLAAVLLVYNPPLFDILPMYVVFLALSPVVLQSALHGRWPAWLAGSAVLWLLAQVDFGRVLYEASGLASWVPYRQTGAFAWLGWQFLWLLGMWVGYRMSGRAQPLFFPRPLLAAAIAIALACFVWRHLVGQAPFGGNSELNAWFDKWHLGPARMLDFAALTIVVIQFGRPLRRVARHPLLARLGAAALPVFCAHLVLCALALAGWKRPDGHSAIEDAGLLLGAFAALYAVAAIASAIGTAPRRRVQANAGFSPRARTAR